MTKKNKNKKFCTNNNNNVSIYIYLYVCVCVFWPNFFFFVPNCFSSKIKLVAIAKA